MNVVLPAGRTPTGITINAFLEKNWHWHFGGIPASALFVLLRT